MQPLAENSSQGVDISEQFKTQTRSVDRLVECKGHVIKNKLLENQSTIKDFNSKPLTPSEMMKSLTSSNCPVNHHNQQK